MDKVVGASAEHGTALHAVVQRFWCSPSAVRQAYRPSAVRVVRRVCCKGRVLALCAPSAKTRGRFLLPVRFVARRRALFYT